MHVQSMIGHQFLSYINFTKVYNNGKRFTNIFNSFFHNFKFHMRETVLLLLFFLALSQDISFNSINNTKNNTTIDISSHIRFHEIDQGICDTKRSVSIQQVKNKNKPSFFRITPESGQTADAFLLAIQCLFVFIIIISTLSTSNSKENDFSHLYILIVIIWQMHMCWEINDYLNISKSALIKNTGTIILPLQIIILLVGLIWLLLEIKKCHIMKIELFGIMLYTLITAFTFTDYDLHQEISRSLYIFTPLVQLYFSFKRQNKLRIHAGSACLYNFNMILWSNMYCKGLSQYSWFMQKEVILLMIIVSTLCGDTLINFFKKIFGMDLQPKRRYRTYLKESNEKQIIRKGELCAICLQEMSLNALVVDIAQIEMASRQCLLRTPCNHFYHVLCLIKWLRVKLTCPVDCRSILNQQDNG